MRTRAIVFEKRNRVVLQDIEMPDPKPGEARVKTEFSTVSVGTEGWILQDLFTWVPTPYPCVSGYQRMGTITALGDGVEGWRIGERVVATGGSWEGAVGAWQGAHAAVGNIAVSDNTLFRIPEGVDPVDASALVVAQVGYNAASRVACAPRDWAVVFGDGIIGQSAAQAARARGMKVVLIGHRPERLALAAQYSADVVVNSHEQAAPEAVREITGRDHVRAVLDSVQGESVQSEYMALLEHARGQIVYCGFTPNPTWADMGLLQQHEFTTHFVSGWAPERMRATLALMAQGKMSVRPLITHMVPFDQGPEMYRMVLGKDQPFTGITFDWRGEKS